LIPVVLLGVVWRGRALFPAVLALVFCGVVDELVNGETCLPASEWGCGGPVDAAYFSILIVTPMILLGAAVSHVVGLGVAAIRR
jgi:hypothetical protein